MSKSGTHSEVVLALAEEFVARYRNGERPSLREYIDRHPELAAEIREVFPAVALMENIALVQEAEESPPTASAPEAAPLQQLGDYRLIRAIGQGGMGIVYEAEQVSLGRHVARLKLLPRKLLADVKHRRRFERRGPLGGQAAPYQHCAGIRRRGAGRPALLCHAVHPGLGPQRGTRGAQAPAGSRRAEECGSQPRDTGRQRAVGGRRGPLAVHRPIRAGRRGLELGAIPSSAAAKQPTGCAQKQPLAASSAGRLLESLSDSSVVLPGQSGPSGQRKAKTPTYWQSVAQIGVQVRRGFGRHAHQQGVLHRDIKPSNLLLDRRTTVWITDFGLAKASDQ